MLFERMKPAAAAAVMLTASMVFETVQYVFSVGTTDVTDLITNTLGGIIGIVSYRLLGKLAKNSSMTDIIILAAAAIVSMVLSVQMAAGLIYFMQ
jgi:glycopeptide antibiotics resistance protein